MFFPIFITIEGHEVRLPLDKILGYRPSYEGAFPTLYVTIDSSIEQNSKVNIQYNTKEELETVVANLDRICTVVPIPKDGPLTYPEPGASSSSGGDHTLQ